MRRVHKVQVLGSNDFLRRTELVKKTPKLMKGIIAVFIVLVRSVSERGAMGSRAE
jgi:hypothetical protein